MPLLLLVVCMLLAHTRIASEVRRGADTMPRANHVVAHAADDSCLCRCLDAEHLRVRQ
jgi:hypothetical protein